MKSIVTRSAGNGVRPGVKTDLKIQRKRNGIRAILIAKELNINTERGKNITTWNYAMFFVFCFYRGGI